MMKCKKIILTILCVFLLISLLSGSVFAATPIKWYFKRVSDHTKPPLPSDLSVICNYDAYYLNEGTQEKVIYLTFDAGYENGNVKKILDILEKHNAHGAFFVLENLITKNTDLILQMARQGHLVCNHTARHKNMSQVTDFAQFQKELMALEDIYREKTGLELAKFYRPPEGTFSEENLAFAQKMGYRTVFWSFAYADWDNKKQPDPDRSLQKLIDHLHPGEILLLHPTSSTNAAILDRFLTQASEMGYRFGSLDELCR